MDQNLFFITIYSLLLYLAVKCVKMAHFEFHTDFAQQQFLFHTIDVVNFYQRSHTLAHIILLLFFGFDQSVDCFRFLTDLHLAFLETFITVRFSFFFTCLFTDRLVFGRFVLLSDPTVTGCCARCYSFGLIWRLSRIAVDCDYTPISVVLCHLLSWLQCLCFNHAQTQRQNISATA